MYVQIITIAFKPVKIKMKTKMKKIKMKNEK